MNNRLSSLLSEWYPNRDQVSWVLGTLYRTEGPCYRKPGAIMLFNSSGQQFGLLSGGCLEPDIQQHAKWVMQSNKPKTLCYDSTDEDDLSFQLGIGCGGIAYILLQPISLENEYLSLDKALEALSVNGSGILRLLVPSEKGETAGRFEAVEALSQNRLTELVSHQGQHWLEIPVRPDPHLLIVGGGIDAIPVMGIAKELGWRVTICDPRPANARRENFMLADEILRATDGMAKYAESRGVDALILMSHSLTIDAAALKAAQEMDLAYLALLGPVHRRDRVLALAELSTSQIHPLAAPAGLDLGGELPESIALSIMAECHARLHTRAGCSLSDVLIR